MKKLDDLQKMKTVEIITIIASLIGIILPLVHGNIYDYFFNLFSIKDVINFRLLYSSLLVYSILAFVVFVSLYVFNEKNVEIRFYTYIQGWLFITMAAATYEWSAGMMLWNIQSILTKQFTESPFNFFTKRASIILFAALFVFWLLEKKKNRVKNS